MTEIFVFDLEILLHSWKHAQIENMDEFQSNASCQGLDANLENRCIRDPLESRDICVHRMQKSEQYTAAYYRTFLHLNHLTILLVITRLTNTHTFGVITPQ